jgi:hypothetical protein
MGDNVRPRINKGIYELVKKAASSSGLPTGHWLVEAIIQKAATEGFEIVDGKVVHSSTHINHIVELKGDHSKNTINYFDQS